MNTILSFLIQMLITFLLAFWIVRYLQPSLRKILLDLCGTEERAQFWNAFSNILLLGMPLIFALNYRPETRDLEKLFFDVAGKVSGNLGGLLVALIGIGFIVSFFALVAPKPKTLEPK
jgi:hypothetical protein